jgi:hypothetical protein
MTFQDALFEQLLRSDYLVPKQRIRCHSEKARVLVLLSCHQVLNSIFRIRENDC